MQSRVYRSLGTAILSRKSHLGSSTHLHALEIRDHGRVVEERVPFVDRIDLASRGDLDVWVSEDELAESLIVSGSVLEMEGVAVGWIG